MTAPVPVLDAATTPAASAVKAPRVYFPNLNALRFIAATMVIVHHIEGISFRFGLLSWARVPAIQVGGKLGVVLFFVLSGFLITYLLLTEEKSAGTVNVREFYIRRVLRIWPLYYLILALGLFIMPYVPGLLMPGFPPSQITADSGIKLLLYVLLLPNLELMLYSPIPYASQAWSIGTEEQFYLIWPWLVRWMKRGRIGVLLAIIGGCIFIKLGLPLVPTLPYERMIVSFMTHYFPVDCMAIGGIFAVLVFQKSIWLERIVFHRAVQVGNLLVLGGLLARGIQFPHAYHYDIYSLFFAVFIVNMAANPRRLFSLETPVLDYLGKISYGLYMYHALAIVMSIQLLRHVVGGVTNWLLYPLSFGVTILLAGLSYRFLEEPFIRFKARFSRVLSGENAK